ncbi:MAG TPA: glycosyltransferase [Candidatus Polarisedimenticolaceae bacterium]|nr:glycosyltransferase [Candidatus Polarisedimenticolaceae bacterium]
MATIAIAPYPWAADLNCAFGLARKLVERGHDVRFLGVPDTESRIRSQGFAFAPFLGEALPAGSLDRVAELEARGEDNAWPERFRATCAALEAGALERAVDALGAELLLVSSWTPWITIAAWRLGLRLLQFSSILPSIEDPQVPPFQTDLVPGAARCWRLRTRLAWSRMFAARCLFGGALNIRPQLERLARRSGFPLERVDFRVETWPRLRIGELVFCPPEFDFPRSRELQGALFVEPSIDLARRDHAFPWERLRDDRPLVYCSLGSVVLSKFPRDAARLIQLFLDALAARPRLQGVAAIGRYVDARTLRCPDNVVLRDEAPQLRLLARSRLMVSHGGLTGVKEAIYHGVPLLVVPFFFDQPGNAARVAFHGLGGKARLAGLDASGLGRRIDAVLGDADCAARVARMSALFVAHERAARAAHHVERTLGELRPR